MTISTKQIRPMDALHMVARTQDVRDGFALIDRIAALEDVVRELCDNCLRDEKECPYCRKALELVNQGGK